MDKHFYRIKFYIFSIRNVINLTQGLKNTSFWWKIKFHPNYLFMANFRINQIIYSSMTSQFTKLKNWKFQSWKNLDKFFQLLQIRFHCFYESYDVIVYKIAPETVILAEFSISFWSIRCTKSFWQLSNAQIFVKIKWLLRRSRSAWTSRNRKCLYGQVRSKTSVYSPVWLHRKTLRDSHRWIYDGH